MSHSDIETRYEVQMSHLCLEINTTKVVNTMIPISAMAELFNLLVSVSFLFGSLHAKLTICMSHSNIELRYGVQMSSL